MLFIFNELYYIELTLFRYGYITLAYWCSKEMEISLINPQFFHNIAFKIEK